MSKQVMVDPTVMPAPEGGRQIVIPFNFRFPVKQVGEREVEVILPVSDRGFAILRPEMIEALRLSDSEIETAEIAALKSIALIKE